jgi:AraC-like DNA-binding protein
VTRHIDNQPDITTVFEFKQSFFEKIKQEYFPGSGWFLQNNDMHAIMLACPPELDHMHHFIMQLIQKRKFDRLQVDELVMHMLNKVLHILANASEVTSVPEKLKQHHLGTIERAKEYLLNNFHQNISLNELAEHCYVSPFHLSRIFKSILNVSPHQYLLSTRLHHAKILLMSTEKPVNDIGFESGFNSVEHFVTAYKLVFKVTPSQHRVTSSVQ